MGECEGQSKAPNDLLPFDPSQPDTAEKQDSVSSNSICKHLSGAQSSPGNAEKVGDCADLLPELSSIVMSLPECQVLKSESSTSTDVDHVDSELEQKRKGLLYLLIKYN